MFDYMETDEVADLLGVGPAHVRWLARNQPDRVGARKFGRSWIYQREAVEAYAAGYERRRGRPANDEDRPATPPCRSCGQPAGELYPSPGRLWAEDDATPCVCEACAESEAAMLHDMEHDDGRDNITAIPHV